MISNRFLEAFKEVIGGVGEPFTPTVDITGYYGDVELSNGCKLRAAVTQNAPRVEIGGEHNELYTLMMVDPDAPNQIQSQLPDVVSWIVTNIPGGSSCTQGTEVLPYGGPQTEVGIHQYILVLYKQQSQLSMEPLTTRLHSNARGFASVHNLGNPVGMAFFTFEK